MTLKNFLLREEVRRDHALNYLIFTSRYHHLVIHDLRRSLTEEWKKSVADLKKKHPLSAQAKKSAELRNENATTSLELVPDAVKLTTTRSRGPVEACPSVKIPVSYPTDTRSLLERELLDVAEKCFYHLVEGWSSVFHYQHNGKRIPAFKIMKDHEEVKLQLATSLGEHEEYKTLYTVRSEYGRQSLKLKDFDRIYLTSLVHH